MKRFLCALALVSLSGLACAQSLAGNSLKNLSANQAPSTGTLFAGITPAVRFGGDVVAPADAKARVAPEATSEFVLGANAAPESQNRALLLAGLGAIVFIAVRRRRH